MLYIGVDLGTSAVKLLLMDGEGNIQNIVSKEYPQYDWKGNKGYPTKKHRLALAQYGTTPYHRMTFRLLDTQQTLNFDFE